MAKQQDQLKKIFKLLLPKAVTGVLTFQNPPFSPRRDHQVVQKYYKHHGAQKGSTIMMIPEEARRRRSNYGSCRNRSIRSLEPTSPTVSCMGQIKLKKNQHHQQRGMKKAKSKRITLPNVNNHARPLLIRSVSTVVKKKKKKQMQTSTFRRIFLRRGRTSSRALGADGGLAAPELGQMKRFASGRGALANIDWKQAHHVVAAPEDDGETIVSFSETIVALQPKPEINLWKRRNMAPPPPLLPNPRPAPI